MNALPAESYRRCALTTRIPPLLDLVVLNYGGRIAIDFATLQAIPSCSVFRETLHDSTMI